MKIEWARYHQTNKEEWDDFVQCAKNSHFLFYRDYMEYHKARFQDASLLCRVNGKLLALLPGNEVDQTFYTHQGLTFGGFIVNDKMNANLMVHLCFSLCDYLTLSGFNTLVYKSIPHIYHKQPCEEDIYGLFRCNAELTRVESSTSIDYQLPGKFSSQRKRGMKKSLAFGLSYRQSQHWEEFWVLLTNRLKDKHGTSPTHCVDEIKMLADFFPQHIKLFVAEVNQEVLAGVVIYETDTVAHAQYIASSEEGLACGALDGLFQMLIHQYAGNKRYFDFGISTESQGTILNEGLARQKEQFGGATVVHSVLTIKGW